jgi:hypothetical protein
MPAYAVVLFHSTAHALRAEKVLQSVGVATKMIPTPRQLSSDCGMALRFARVDSKRVEEALKEGHVPTNGIHEL